MTSTESATIDVIRPLEKAIEAPDGTLAFLHDLNQDDWSFVLKAHSTAETVLRAAIVMQLKPDERGILNKSAKSMLYGEINDGALQKHIFAIPWSGSGGILDLAKSLNLLTTNDLTFLRALGKIRNRYAHSIKNHKKSADEMISEDDNPTQFKANLCYKASTEGGYHKLTGRTAIVVGTLGFLFMMNFRIDALSTRPPGLMDWLRDGEQDTDSARADGRDSLD